MGARSRNTGAAFERKIAKMLREIGIPAERNLTETRTGNAGDIDLPSACPLVIQAKCGKQPRIYKALAEAEEAALDTDYPVAIIHRDGAGNAKKADEIAVMRLADFMELVNSLYSMVWR